MELKDFTGAHMLSGIDRVEKEDMHGIAFIIDGKQYAVYEDPSDGYRSYLTELEEYKEKILNLFPYQQVVGMFKDNILTLIKPSDSSLILKLGTDESDDWYPYAIMEFHPENMDVNITYTFQPLQRVLVRDSDSQQWIPDLFFDYREDKNQSYVCVTGSWNQCIPYLGNEDKLLKIEGK